jgi:predicted TIM-barrel fold metal-dependent hydrolase
MYASDFPHWDFDEPEQTLRQLPPEWRDNVRWRNADAFFRLLTPVRA